ncbi:MAG TPA: hypothetical protein VM582_09180 [Candidatus Thermoplasmatota archaeon]|nr:hypothetical protein [Candidatus Thermoplasmatota archaeon]
MEAHAPSAPTPTPNEVKPEGKAKYTTISIPQPLYLEVKKAIEGTGFRSPTEFLVYVTRLSLQQGTPASDPRAPRPYMGAR